MINTITCLWFQKELDDMSKMCIESWLKLGYKVVIYTYSIGFRNEWINTKYDRLVSVKDGNEVYNNKVNLVKLEYRADLFRFKLFERREELTCWCDTDVYLIRKLPEEVNYVSSQYTLCSGLYKHKEIRVMPNIGVMVFDGCENINWTEIISRGLNARGTELQSSFLKYYEKLMLNQDETLIMPPEAFCPIHWAWAKDIYTKPDIENRMKYGLKPIEYCRFKTDKGIYGIHLWRQLYKKNQWRITPNSILHKLKKSLHN